jgi:hypothetical protein
VSVFDQSGNLLARRELSEVYAAHAHCCLAQFAPDGVVRAVQLDLRESALISNAKHFLYWDGMYLIP